MKHIATFSSTSQKGIIESMLVFLSNSPLCNIKYSNKCTYKSNFTRFNDNHDTSYKCCCSIEYNTESDLVFQVIQKLSKSGIFKMAVTPTNSVAKKLCELEAKTKNANITKRNSYHSRAKQDKSNFHYTYTEYMSFENETLAILEASKNNMKVKAVRSSADDNNYIIYFLIPKDKKSDKDLSCSLRRDFCDKYREKFGSMDFNTQSHVTGKTIFNN